MKDDIKTAVRMSLGKSLHEFRQGDNSGPKYGLYIKMARLFAEKVCNTQIFQDKIA